jgi:hypothetical protein
MFNLSRRCVENRRHGNIVSYSLIDREVARPFRGIAYFSMMYSGLWDPRREPDGGILKSYTVITTQPNELLAPVHNQMPAILNDSDVLGWLSGDESVTL